MTVLSLYAEEKLYNIDIDFHVETSKMLCSTSTLINLANNQKYECTLADGKSAFSIYRKGDCLKVLIFAQSKDSGELVNIRKETIKIRDLFSGTIKNHTLYEYKEESKFQLKLTPTQKTTFSRDKAWLK